jgi:hypothetical protein
LPGSRGTTPDGTPVASRVGTVLRRAPGHPGPLLLLWFFLGLTLGGVQSAAAVMLLGYPEAPPPPPGGLRAQPMPAPARTRR